MKKLILALILPAMMFSQKRELGEVTVKELEEKRHPVDTSAVAAILYEKGKTIFDYNSDSGFTVETEVEVKIKIYKKEGYDWATKAVSYQIGSSSETVNFSKANTYNLVNGKIVKTKLTNDGEFYEKNNEYWATKKITLPNVKEGSIIEYRYVVKSPIISKIDNWKFQTVIPVNYSEFTIAVPQYFDYNTYSRGFENIVKSEEVEKRTISFVSGGSRGSYVFNETVSKYYMENIPAFKPEQFSNTIENYLSSIEFELATTRFPDSPVKNYSVSWADVTKTIYANDSFGGELNKTGYFEEDLKVVLNNKFESNKHKINAILEFVKNRIKWNDFIGIYTDKGVKRAYQDKIGNSAEINFILISMLRSAGYDANPILVSTRDKPVTLYASRTAYNYVVCGVEIENEVLLLDATEKYSFIDVLPTRTLNHFGRIIRKNGSSNEVNLTPKKHAKEFYLISGVIDNNGVVTGRINEKLEERAAYIFRSNNGDLADDSYLEKIEKNNQGLEINNYNIKNKSDCSQPVSKDYEFVYNNASEVINGKIYLKPLLYLGLDENPFKLEERDYPVDFIAPFHDSYTINYTIPDGYVVESLPSSQNIKMVDDLGAFSFRIGNTGNRIQIICNFSMNTSIVGPDNYLGLKEFFNIAVLKMNEKIVLKKL